MTEREVVLRERAAAARAIDWFTTRARCDYGINCGIDALDARRYVEENHPLPTVTRPRVVRDAHNQDREWRVVQGRIETRTPYGSAWHDANNGTLEQPGWMPERVKLLADLLANPTETVPEDA